MERKHLILSWGMRVGSDVGWSGRLRAVYLAPRSGRVTHILVRRGLRRRTEPLRFDDPRQGENGVLMLPGQQQDAVAPGRGSVPFSARTVVHSSDGASLSLRGLIVDSKSRTIESILVGERGNASAVSHQHVQNLTSGSPSVTLAQADLEALPVFRPDDEGQRNARAALASADPTGGDTFRAVWVQVVDGTAHLGGNVRLPVQRAEAEAAVGRATGVLGVESAIVSDWELEIAIAQALAREGAMRQGLVLVKGSLGRVALSGHLSSQEYVDLAVAVARNVPGVRSVEHGVEVRPVPVAEEAAVASENADHPPGDGATEPRTSE